MAILRRMLFLSVNKHMQLKIVFEYDFWRYIVGHDEPEGTIYTEGGVE